MQKKLLKLTDFDKVLVSYLKTPSKLTAKVEYHMFGPRAVLEKIGGEKIGVVVALAPNIFGWSLCKTKGDIFYEADKFDKAKGLSIALSRANYVSTLNDEQKLAYYANKLPDSLLELFGDMQVRAEKYFNYKK